MFLPPHTEFHEPILSMIQSAHAAARLIPPAFPLAATVAVNPYLGHSDQTLSRTAALLRRAGGVAVTLPRAWFRTQVQGGHITAADLDAALASSPDAGDLVLAQVMVALTEDRPAAEPLPTVAQLAAQASGIDWPAVVARCIGGWAAAWFDQGQALWPAPRGHGAYGAWRAYAMHDLTPEIAGLSGFAARVNADPDAASLALVQHVQTLGLTPDSVDSVFHRLLMDLGGWAQAARWKMWQAEQAGGTDDSVIDLLTIRLAWDAALLTHYADKIASDWTDVMAEHAVPARPTLDDRIDAVLQAAAEHAHERNLRTKLGQVVPVPQSGTRPSLQAAFCIDVRSEPFRRALESCDANVQTLGFAGFFGLPLSHRPKGACSHEAHLPVLLTPALTTEPQGDDEPARIAARATRAWGRFKLAAVSSFAFVEATGPMYAGKLVRDALGLHLATKVEPAPVLSGLDADGRIEVAQKVLTAMGLLGPLAPVVLLVGHGAQVTNNAHASALQCGACGGHDGAVSARALAALLNDGAVRAGLAAKGSPIPTDTRFIAALHDTTSDTVTLFDAPTDLPSDLRTWLDRAGVLARAERAASLPRAGLRGADIPARARDWAEVRPEWGLAGCAAFVAAPRTVTRGQSLGGRAFLHDYHWPSDPGFGVLELILTAPVVVASWISLQYYGSVTAPDTFGAGNKLLHNVVGGFGVFEGNGATPRVGLPWQSVHDGTRIMHDPLRLTVAVAAPQDAIDDILSRHANVRALFDNGWLRLVRLDDTGQMVARYMATGWGAI